MQTINKKLQAIQHEVHLLTEYCLETGDEKTRQLLLEVLEILDITHSSLQGKSLRGFSNHSSTHIKSH
ncbi:hypothetical protein [Glaciecola sp. 1036]|uniref:hypothetical protein n=1 Tax=Alteromonadaceae TaxID=72275 RepID=UPI003D05C486